MEFSTAKALAVIGAVLGIVGSVWGVSPWWLLGLILYLVGLYYISRIYGRPEIFTYALIASVGASIVALAGFLLAAALLFRLTGAAATESEVATMGLGVAMLLWLVFYIAMLIMGQYKRKLMEALAPYADRNLALLTGKLYWIGSALAIIIVGLVIVIAAVVLEIIVLSGLREPGEAAVEAAGERRGEWSTPW